MYLEIESDCVIFIFLVMHIVLIDLFQLLIFNSFLYY